MTFLCFFNLAERSHCCLLAGIESFFCLLQFAADVSHGEEIWVVAVLGQFVDIVERRAAGTSRCGGSAGSDNYLSL